MLALSVGQSLGGPLRRTALLAPHGQDLGDGPADFQINVTAAEGGIMAARDRRELAARAGPRRAGTHPLASLSRAQLLAMTQHTAHLPIACVEGWSTGNQAWTGVRLRDLARLAGAGRPASVLVRVAGTRGRLPAGRPVGGPDHGPGLAARAARQRRGSVPRPRYPARIIVPASPGVHNTKWVASLTFRS